MRNKLAVSLDELAVMGTAHDAGTKKIMFSGADTRSALTQFAFGRLLAGETIGAHQHPTMEEYFYFLKGSGTYTVGEEVIRFEQGTAVKIPAATKHILHSTEELEFVYFGIAVEL